MKNGPTAHGLIDVIVRKGRLKPSGVRGKQFDGYQFKNVETGKVMCFMAVCEENARKQLIKTGCDEKMWVLNRIFNYHSYHGCYMD